MFLNATIVSSLDEYILLHLESSCVYFTFNVLYKKDCYVLYCWIISQCLYETTFILRRYVIM